MALFNLLDQLAFYGAYHSNRWNKLIHFLFVPLILWTVLVWLAAAGPLVTHDLDTSAASALLHAPTVLNTPLLLVICYSLFYVALDPVAGATWALLVGTPLWLSATTFQASVPNANKWAVLLHVLSWYMQIHPGHAVLEKRKPALMDSLIQAFALAPLFVWFEVLFLFRYRPGLHAALKERVGKDVAAFRRRQAEQQAKKA